jgi:hypothetical protein
MVWYPGAPKESVAGQGQQAPDVVAHRRERDSAAKAGHSAAWYEVETWSNGRDPRRWTI